MTPLPHPLWPPPPSFLQQLYAALTCSLFPPFRHPALLPVDTHFTESEPIEETSSIRHQYLSLCHRCRQQAVTTCGFSSPMPADFIQHFYQQNSVNLGFWTKTVFGIWQTILVVNNITTIITIWNDLCHYRSTTKYRCFDIITKCTICLVEQTWKNNQAIQAPK